MNYIYKHLLVLCFGFLVCSVNAQNVGIGTNTPDPSAALHIEGVNQGLLIPKTDTLSVATPAKGLLVYQEIDQSFYYFTGSTWAKIITSNNDAHDDLGNHIATKTINTNTNWISGDGDLEGVYISKEGNVGINNGIPDVPLDVVGKFRFADGTEGINKVMVTSNATGLGTWTDMVNVQDNLGNHVATDHLKMSGNWISNDTDKEGVFVSESGNVGIGNSGNIGTSVPNTLSVAGKVAIGTSYANSFSAPPNSLLLEGDLVIGTINKEVNGITLQASNGTSPVGITQGLFAGNSALELTTADGEGIQTSRITLRGGNHLTDIGFHTGASGAELTMMHMEGTTQNIGIGTLTPGAKLEVAGDIKGEILDITSLAQIDELIVNQEIFFSEKNLYATGTSYISNIVTGSVTAAGGISGGSNTTGITVVRISEGWYQVVFPAGAFSTSPVITVTASSDGASDNRFAVILAKSEAKFDVIIKNAGGNTSDAPFDFIAIGKR